MLQGKGGWGGGVGEGGGLPSSNLTKGGIV